MNIIKGWNGERWLWVVQERRAIGREKETAFESEANAKVYRDLVRAARRTADPIRQAKMAEKIESMRGSVAQVMRIRPPGRTMRPRWRRRRRLRTASRV